MITPKTKLTENRTAFEILSALHCCLHQYSWRIKWVDMMVNLYSFYMVVVFLWRFRLRVVPVSLGTSYSLSGSCVTRKKNFTLAFFPWGLPTVTIYRLLRGSPVGISGSEIWLISRPEFGILKEKGDFPGLGVGRGKCGCGASCRSASAAFFNSAAVDSVILKHETKATTRRIDRAWESGCFAANLFSRF